MISPLASCGSEIRFFAKAQDTTFTCLPGSTTLVAFLERVLRVTICRYVRLPMAPADHLRTCAFLFSLPPIGSLRCSFVSSAEMHSGMEAEGSHMSMHGSVADIPTHILYGPYRLWVAVSPPCCLLLKPVMRNTDPGCRVLADALSEGYGTTSKVEISHSSDLNGVGSWP
jgi:hypothetical protein